MLIRLIKHDLRSSYRQIMPLYLALILFAVFAAVVLKPESRFFAVFFFLLLVAILSATAIILIQTISRLYIKQLYSHEGYLTWSLPVSTTETFLSKIITVFIWSTVTLLVYTLSIIVFGSLWSLINRDIVNQLLGTINSETFKALLGLLRDVGQMMLPLIPQSLVSGFSGSALILSVIVFVNTSYVKNHKLVKGFILFFALSSILEYLNNLINIEFITINTYQNYFTYSINWSNYAINLVYHLFLALGLFSIAVWLNDHKMEIQ